MDNTARLLRERVRGRRQALEQTWSDTQDVPWSTRDISGTGNDVMELEELRAGSPSPPRLTTQVTPFHHSQSPIPSNASGSQEADEMMRSLREKRLQRKEQLQTTIKATVHYPARLPPLKHERSPESSNLRPPLLTKPIGNGEEREESGDLVDNRMRKEHRSRELTESIRQRMRQKLQEAKRGMPEDETGDQQKPTRRLRALRPREVPTRFDEPLGPSLASASGFTLDRAETEDPLRSGLSSDSLAKSRWRQAIDSTIPHKSVSHGEKDMSYHFFTQSLEEPFEELFPQCTPVMRDEPDEGATAVSGDVAVTEGLEEEQPTDELDTSALIEPGQLEDEEAQYGTLTVKGYPSYEPHSDILQQESELYFTPPTESIRIEDKLPGQDPPRYLAEEGIYVGKRPRVSFANYNRMENRLLQQEDKGKSWFAEDGRLAYLPDPLKKPPGRPHIWRDSQTAVIQTDYKLPREETFDSQFIDGSGTGGGRYQLDVDVSTLQFSHHSLFSAEHVLASRLTQLYTQFCDSQKKGTTQFLTDKLRALKEASYHLEETLGPVEPVAGTGLDEQFQRLKEYKHEIRQVRQLRDTQELADKTLLKNIFRCWNELKALREQQGYNNTSLKLVARKEAVSMSEDQVKWRREIDEEISELRELYEEKFNQLVLEYHQEMEIYTRQKKAIRKELKRRQRQAQSAASAGEADETIAPRDDDADDTGPLREPTRPEPPAPFNEDQVRQEVTDKAQRNRRQPGHPILHPVMDNSVGITPTHQCPRDEQLRRRDVQRSSHYIRVQFNGKEVSRTSTRHLGGDFSVHLGEIFNMQIRQWPETITLQIYESLGSGSHTLLSDVYVAIPPPQLHSANVSLENMDFSSSLEVHHDHAAVGSGVEMPLPLNPTHGNFLLTSGSLKCSVCWSRDDNGKVLCPPLLSQPTRGLGGTHQTDAVAALGAAGMVDIRKLAAWIAEAKLDPNDPRNADLLYLVKTHAGDDPACLAKQEYFRLSEMEKDTYFCSDEDLDQNKRFRLIQLRDQEMQDFSTYKMIPVNEAEVKDTVFKDVEKKFDEEVMDERKSRRMAVTKFFREVQDRVIERSKKASKKRELRDVVIEEEVPDIRLLGASIAKILEPKRPLKPERKERKTIFAQVGGVSDIKLLVRVVRAFDIPIRQSHSSQAAEQHRPLPQRHGQQPSRTTRILDEEGSEVASSNDANLMRIEFAQQVQVRPFVEVTFQQQTCVTPVVDGPNPSWNAELTMPFTSPNNDYSATGLQTVPDQIYFNLFDELLIDVLEDDRERATTRHERIERRWLGSFSIPFSTVYSNTRVDGTFQLSVPPILLGYARDTYTSQRSSGPTAFDMTLDSHQQTFLSLFLTIEPPLPPLPPLREQFDSNEDPKLLRNCQLWQESLLEKFKRRQIDMTAVDINGKTVFITRYILPQKPPDEVLQNQEPGSLVAMELVARFVSMIPSLADAAAFMGTCDIWATSDQFLQMQAGDEEEHAVLLCNYFLHMGKKAWVVLGSGIPEGSTAYVLTEDPEGSLQGDYWLWNATTGEHFHQYSSNCPLRSVGCVFNEDNIWANIQKHDEPALITFNLSSTSYWKPFFTTKYPNPGLGSVQKEIMNYKQPDIQFAETLQDKVEMVLMKKIEESRQLVTRWNRHCSNELRKILPKLEDKPNDYPTAEHNRLLRDILTSYSMAGFPLHMPFTEVDAVVEAVYNTHIHDVADRRVEFALAVYVHPYPNDIYSLWVYVVALNRRR